MMHVRRRRFLAAVAAIAALARVPARAADAPVLLVVGDSISAGYGLAAGEVWVDLLAAKLTAAGYRYQVVNASISGDTTAGGRARIASLLRQHQPSVVIVELGGNDALRGGNLAATRTNLDGIVKESQAAGAKVLIAGMQLPPNYGPVYVRQFNALFGDVAKERKAALVPYVFDGFGDDLVQFQPDRI